MPVCDLLTSTSFHFAKLLASSSEISTKDSDSFAKSSILANDFAIDISMVSEEHLIAAAYFLLHKPPNAEKYLKKFFDKIQKSFMQHFKFVKNVSKVTFGYVTMIFLLLNDMIKVYPDQRKNIIELQIKALNQCLELENPNTNFFIMNFLGLFCVTLRDKKLLFEIFLDELEKDERAKKINISFFLEKFSSRASALFYNVFKLATNKSELTLIELGQEEKDFITKNVDVKRIVLMWDKFNIGDKSGLTGPVMDFCNDMKTVYGLNSFDGINFVDLFKSVKYTHTFQSYIFEKYSELKYNIDSLDYFPGLLKSFSSISQSSNPQNDLNFLNIDILAYLYILKSSDDISLLSQNSEKLMNILRDYTNNFNFVTNGFETKFVIKHNNLTRESSINSSISEAKYEDLSKNNIDSILDLLSKLAIQSTDNFKKINHSILLFRVSIKNKDTLRYLDLTFALKALSKIDLSSDSEIKTMIFSIVDQNLKGIKLPNADDTLSECPSLPILTHIFANDDNLYPELPKHCFYTLLTQIDSIKSFICQIDFNEIKIQNSKIIEILIQKAILEFDHLCISIFKGSVDKLEDLKLNEQWKHIYSLVAFLEQFSSHIEFENTKVYFKFILNFALINSLLKDIDLKSLNCVILDNFLVFDTIFNFMAQELIIPSIIDIERLEKFKKYETIASKLTSQEPTTACFTLLLGFIERINIKYGDSSKLFITFDYIKILSSKFNDSEIKQILLLVLTDIYDYELTNVKIFWEMLVYRFIELSLYIKGFSDIFKEFFVMGHANSKVTVKRCDLVLNAFLKIFDVVPCHLDSNLEPVERVLMSENQKYPIILPYDSIHNNKSFNSSSQGLKKYFELFFLQSSEAEFPLLFTKIAIYIVENKVHQKRGSSLISCLVNIVENYFANLNKKTNLSLRDQEDESRRRKTHNTLISSFFIWINELDTLILRPEQATCVSPLWGEYFDFSGFKGVIKNANYLFEIRNDEVKVKHYFDILNYMLAKNHNGIFDFITVFSKFIESAQNSNFGIYDKECIPNDPYGPDFAKVPKIPNLFVFTESAKVLKLYFNSMSNYAFHQIHASFLELSLIFLNNGSYSKAMSICSSPHTFLFRLDLYLIFTKLTDRINDQKDLGSLMKIEKMLFELLIDHYRAPNFVYNFKEEDIKKLLFALKNCINNVCLNHNLYRSIKYNFKTNVSYNDSNETELDLIASKYCSKIYCLRELLKNDQNMISSISLVTHETARLSSISNLCKDFSALAEDDPTFFIYGTARFFNYQQSQGRGDEIQYTICSAIENNIDLYVKYPIVVAKISKNDNLKSVLSQNIVSLSMAKIDFLPALEFLSKSPINRHPVFQKYVYSIIESTDQKYMLRFVPQFTQLIRYDEQGYLTKVLLGLCKSSTLLSHLILFNLQSNFYQDDEKLKEDSCFKKFTKISEDLKKMFNDQQMNSFNRVEKFCNDLIAISKQLRNYDPQTKRPKKALEEIKKVNVPERIYLPTDPNYLIVDIDRKSIKPMTSAKKAPFLIKFKLVKVGFDVCEKYCTNQIESYDKYLPVETKAFIIKFGDDLRTDILALQILDEILSLSEIYGSGLISYAYKVVSINQGCGIIECIPNSNSLHHIIGDLKKESKSDGEGGLVIHFRNLFGAKCGNTMNEARVHLSKSYACSIIFMFLIALKDRHNGNMMMDIHGNLLQIDFGFIFGHAPRVPESAIKYPSYINNLMKRSDEDNQCINLFNTTISRGFVGLMHSHERLGQIVRSMDGCALPGLERGNSSEMYNGLVSRFKEIYKIKRGSQKNDSSKNDANSTAAAATGKINSIKEYINQFMSGNVSDFNFYDVVQKMTGSHINY